MVIAYSQSLFASYSDEAASIYQGLSESQHFRSYPYVDKAFRLESKVHYSAALFELQKALKLAPDHPPYNRYALSLGKKAGLSLQELEILIEKLSEIEQRTERYQLRFEHLQQGPMLSAHEFKQMTQGLSKQQGQDLYLSLLFAIEKKHGKSNALKWGENQFERNKSADAYRFEAYQWFEEKQYQRVLPLIEQLAQTNQINKEDVRYLMLSLLYLGRDADASAIVKQQTSSELETLYLRSRAEIFLNKRYYAEAQKELLRLQIITSLTATEQEQLDYIASLSELEMQYAKHEVRAFPQCLKTVLNVQRQKGMKVARQELLKCDPNDSTINWMNTAEKIKAYAQLEQYVFTRPHHEIKRKRILTDFYINSKNWQAVIDLLKNPKIKYEVQSLAMAYSNLRQPVEAANTWLYLYKLENDLKYIDFSAYNASLAQQPKLESKIYQQAMSSQPKAFIENKPLMERAASLAYTDITLFTVNEIETIAGVKGLIEPTIWLEQQQCAHLMSSNTDASYFSLKARAHCQLGSQSVLAIETLLHAMSIETYVDDHALIAGWLYQSQQYQAAVSQWGNVTFASLSKIDKNNYIDALVQSSQYLTAEMYWNEFGDDSNVRWWELGIANANAQKNHKLAVERMVLAFEATQSSAIAVMLVDEYVLSNNNTALNELLDSVNRHDNSGEISAELGYLLSNSYPKRAQALLANAASKERYKLDVSLWAQYAYLTGVNGAKGKSQAIYQQLIDDFPLDDIQQEYFQRAHRDTNTGWKFSITGWVGESNGTAVPGYSDKTGNFFLAEEAKRYFDSELFSTLAFRIAGSHSGQHDSDSGRWNSSELDLGVEIKPWEMRNYFAKFGLKKGLESENNDTQVYIWLSADVFSNDDWSKAWQNDKESWLYQQLYIDGIYYLDGEGGHSLYARYDLGYSFKVDEENRQRVIPYTFVQKSESEFNGGASDDYRVGMGVSWAWDWKQDRYNGLSVNSEVGIEWQHIIAHSNYTGSGDSLMLRFSSYF